MIRVLLERLREWQGPTPIVARRGIHIFEGSLVEADQQYGRLRVCGIDAQFEELVVPAFLPQASMLQGVLGCVLVDEADAREARRIIDRRDRRPAR